MKKIIGIITYNRPYLLEQSLRSLNIVLGDKRNEYDIFVADDGSVGDETRYTLERALESGWIDNFRIYGRGGVSVNSNNVIRYFKEQDGDLLFILNDDIELVSNPFEYYENAFENTDFHHFAYNDPSSPNKSSGSFIENGIRFNEYELVSDGVCLAMDRKCIDTIGGFREEYWFAIEHIQYSHRASLAGLTGGHRILDVADAAGSIKVLQYYTNNVKPSLKNADAHKANSRELWLDDYWKPKLYEEI